MNRIQYAKLLGLVVAVATSLVSFMGGDIVTGSGILAAAFSSSTAFRKNNED